jgi:hypothetical protein
MKDFIKGKIMKIFREANNDGILDLQDAEVEKLTTMVLSVAMSNIETRLFFYSEVSEILHEVQKRLKREKDVLLDKILGRGKHQILN